MHGKHRNAYINGAHGQQGRGYAAKSGAASDIGAIGEFPIRNIFGTADSLNDSSACGIGGLRLAGSKLDSYAVSHYNLVFNVAFFHVIWMNGVGNVHGEQETT